VKATAIDAAKAGFSTHFLADYSRGVNPEGIKEAILEMNAAGIQVHEGDFTGTAPECSTGKSRSVTKVEDDLPKPPASETEKTTGTGRTHE
jgi:hypothetical protein